MRRYFALLGGGAVNEAPQILAQDFLFIHPPLTSADGSVGREEFLAQVLGPARVAFPDMTFTITDVLVEGNSACARWTMSATHLAAYMGVQASGKRVEVDGMNLFHTESGLIVATWVARDNLGLLRQLGAA